MAEQAGYLDTVEQGLALHPEQAATSAAQVDLLFWVLVAVCVALVLTLFALVIGVTVFGESPDALTLTGAAVIVLSGIYTVWRERKIGVLP